MTSVPKTMQKDQGGSVGTFRGDYYRSGRHCGGGLVSKSEIFYIKAIFNTTYHISLVQQNHSNKLYIYLICRQIFKMGKCAKVTRSKCMKNAALLSRIAVKIKTT